MPGTLWFDTATNQLKIWYAYAIQNPLDGDDDTIGTLQNAYTGQWVSATNAHYLTEATQDIINGLQDQVKHIDRSDSAVRGYHQRT